MLNVEVKKKSKMTKCYGRKVPVEAISSIAAKYLVAQGTRASAAMVLAYFFRNIPASEVFNLFCSVLNIFTNELGHHWFQRWLVAYFKPYNNIFYSKL